MAIAIDVIEKSINQTTGFFKGPGMWRRWANFAFIIFIFTMLTGEGIGGSGGGSNFNLGDSSLFNPDQGGDSFDFTPKTESFFPGDPLTAFASITDGLPDFEQLIPIIIGVVLFLLVLGFLLRIVGNAAMFGAIKAAEKNKLEPGLITGNFPKGVSLAIVQLVFGLLSLPFLIMFIAAFLGFFVNIIAGFIPGGENPLSQIPILNDPTALILIGIVGFGGILFFGIINYFLKQFGVYLMHRKGIGAFQALREGIGLGLGNIKELAILILVQIGLGIALGILAGLLGLLIAIPFLILLGGIVLITIMAQFQLAVIAISVVIGIVVALAMLYAIAFVTSPLYVFIFKYNLNIIDGFLKSK